jgi:ABC-2 type transport system ATP-binding protein
VAALSDVSVNIREGEIYGIAGLNGAGKSTLLSVLSGVVRPDGGAVLYRGADIRAKGRALRIGYVPQEISLFPDLTVYDNLKFWASVRARPSKSRIVEAAGAAGLSGALKRRVSALSGGMKRRVNIASALVARPDVLVMDEPTAGLDVKNRRDIIKFIMDLIGAQRRAGASGGGAALTVVYTSHQAGELEYVSDRILLLHRGRALFEGAPQDAARSVISGGGAPVSGAAGNRIDAGAGATMPGAGMGAGTASTIDDALYILGCME